MTLKGISRILDKLVTIHWGLGRWDNRVSNFPLYMHLPQIYIILFPYTGPWKFLRILRIVHCEDLSTFFERALSLLHISWLPWNFSCDKSKMVVNLKIDQLLFYIILGIEWMLLISISLVEDRNLSLQYKMSSKTHISK